MDLGLKDKVAVISGGSVGMGLAIAKGLAAEGVHLALCARDAARLAQEARAIEQEFDVRALGRRTTSGSTIGSCMSWRRCGWRAGWCR